MVDTQPPSGRRKVRCPKCTAVFKQPSSPIFWCQVCSTRLSAGERQDCVECDEEVCSTATCEKWEQISNVGNLFPSMETSSTQGLIDSTHHDDALLSKAHEARSSDRSTDSSHEHSFSDLASAPEDNGDSDFDFPVPSQEHAQKEETDLYSQMFHGYFKVQESGSKVMDGNKVTENLITGSLDLLSLVKNAVEKAADISKSLHAVSEDKPGHGDGGEQEQVDDACTGNEEDLEPLMLHENTNVSSRASIYDDEIFITKTVTESDETLDAEQSNDHLLSSQNVSDLLSCCDESVPRPESHDSNEALMGENGKSNSDIFDLLKRAETNHSKVGIWTEGMQAMEQLDDLYNENTNENVDSDARQVMTDAYPQWALSMEVHGDHFDRSNALVSEECTLFNRDNTGYVGIEERGVAYSLKNLLNSGSQDTGIAYPLRTLSSEEHNMSDTSMNAGNYQLNETKLFPSELREPSAELLAHHPSESMDSTESAGYYRGRHIPGIYVNNYVPSPAFTRLPNVGQCGSDSLCWQKDFQSRQRHTAGVPESPCLFHCSQDYPVGWYGCSPHKSLSNHYNQHHISDAILMTRPMNSSGTYFCQCTRHTTLKHNQALACNRCHPLTRAGGLCSPQHSHITQQPLLYHPNQPSYAGYTYPVHPMWDHHTDDPMWASACANALSVSHQARPLVQQIGHENVISAPLCPQPSILRRKKEYPFPGGGMVPYVLCSHCKLILHVPLGIPIAGRMYQKLQCGYCKGISKYSVFSDQVDDQRPMGDSCFTQTNVPLKVKTVPAGKFHRLSYPKDLVEVYHKGSQHPHYKRPTTKGQVLNSYALSSQSTTCASSPVEDYFSDGVTEKRNSEYRKLSFTGNEKHQPTKQESGTVEMPTNNHNILETKSKPVAPTSPLIQLFNQESRKFSLAWSADREPSLSSKTTDDVPASSDGQGEQRTADANKRSKSVHHLSRQAKYFAGRLKKSLREFARIQHKYTNTHGEVIVNGVVIEDAVVQKAEEKAGVIHPGSFWVKGRKFQNGMFQRYKHYY